MSEVPIELVVAAFADGQGAQRALDLLKVARKEKLIGIRDAAVITRDAHNELHIKETGDMRGAKGAGIGALVGGAVGLLFPPAVLATAAAGAVIGGLGARLRDAGFPDERLKETRTLAAHPRRNEAEHPLVHACNGRTDGISILTALR